MNGCNPMTNLASKSVAEEITSEPAIWSKINHSSVRQKILAAIESSNIYLRLAGLCVADPPSVERINGWIDDLNSLIRTIYRIHEEAWEMKGNQKTPEFVRAVYERGLKPHIDQYLEVILRTAEKNLNPGGKSCQSDHKTAEEARLAAETFKQQWSRNCEIEAHELERVFKSNGDDLIGHSQSRHIDIPESPAQELVTSSGNRYLFRIDGKVAMVKYAGDEIRGLQATKGIKLLAFLIAHQGQEFDSPLTLYYAFEGAPIVPFGMKKGETPRPEDGFRFGETSQHYESANQLAIIKPRLIEIDDEIKAAEELGYAKKIEQLEEEKDRILEHVGYVTARSRCKLEWDPQSKNIITKYRNSLNRALDEIRLQANGESLARHLKDALFPFAFPLSYRPEPPVGWQI